MQVVRARHRISICCSCLAVALVAGAVGGSVGPAAAAGSTRSVTVPALWAGSNARGKVVSGIERTTVTTSRTSKPAFAVDLRSLRAKGAGPQWVAASALAAAVGMLYAGQDPRHFGATYAVTGPIDGPSAGAILTVGTLAALRGESLRRSVTMTGTIAPDGTVGVVGLVLAKLEAAAKAGFTTVMIPYGTERQIDRGAEVDAVAYGAARGLRVIVVKDLVTAYRTFTGRSLVPVGAGAPSLDPMASEVAAATTRSLAARLDEARANLPAGVPAADRDALDVQVQQVREALAAGDLARAYGLGVDTYQNLGRASARAATSGTIAAGGLESARLALVGRVDAARARARASLSETAIEVTTLGTAAQLAMPIALGWLTFADATLDDTRTALSDPATSADRVLTAAATVADQEAAIDVFGPDAVAMVRSSGGSPSARPEAVARFLSGYSAFLRTSADANLAYAAAVAGDGGQRANPEVFGPATVMKAGNSVITDTVDPLPAEVEQMARAVTSFAFGEALVSGASFGLRGFGAGTDPTLRSDATLLANSVVTGSALSLSSAADLQGVAPAYEIWQTLWGRAVYEALAGTPREAAGGALGLGEIWYAVIGSRIGFAARKGLAG